MTQHCRLFATSLKIKVMRKSALLSICQVCSSFFRIVIPVKLPARLFEKKTRYGVTRRSCFKGLIPYPSPWRRKNAICTLPFHQHRADLHFCRTILSFSRHILCNKNNNLLNTEYFKRLNKLILKGHYRSKKYYAPAAK